MGIKHIYKNLLNYTNVTWRYFLCFLSFVHYLKPVLFKNQHKTKFSLLEHVFVLSLNSKHYMTQLCNMSK